MNWPLMFLVWGALMAVVHAFKPNPVAEVLSFLLFVIPVSALAVWLFVCLCRFIAALVRGSGR